MHVAVIGSGVVGVCTAYFLAEAGHQVVVVERHGNVAEEASYGNAGVIAPGYVTPWAAPGMPGKILSCVFKSEAPLLFKPTLDPALWRWMRRWLSECELERYRINKARMQRVAFYSSDIQRQMREHYQLDYEQNRGYLQLFRSARDIQMAQPAIGLLMENEVPHRMVDADEARSIEPALDRKTALAGGLYLPQDESGNCPLFTKQLKSIAQSIGVEFQFNCNVRSIRSETRGVTLQHDNGASHVDAVVLAAGVDSAQLLAALGIDVPLYPIKGYSATASIKNFEDAPLAALMDESYKVAITRLGSRIRIAGTAELGSRALTLRDAALRTLMKVGNDWFPDAANYNIASFWCGARPMLPDGAPLLGATPIKDIYLNIGHGSSGWAMAAGSGKILADLVSGYDAEIDMDGLTLARYDQAS
ncbi:MAG TPA: amino acid dehydrogenase [Oxalobacteraceae bacterium]|nr:amino acid dehydrogenase [Oxalobacteraceae bacterium]